jgi:hypothetical protein
VDVTADHHRADAGNSAGNLRSRPEEVADLGDDGCGHQDRAAGDVQAREEVGAGSFVLIARSAATTRGPVSQTITLSAEAVGEQVVVVRAEVRAPAGERAEEGGWPLGCRPEVGAAAGFGEHGGDLLIGELVDESVQLVSVGAHVGGYRPALTELGLVESPVRSGDLLHRRYSGVSTGDQGGLTVTEELTRS